MRPNRKKPALLASGPLSVGFAHRSLWGRCSRSYWHRGKVEAGVGRPAASLRLGSVSFNMPSSYLATAVGAPRIERHRCGVRPAPARAPHRSAATAFRPSRFDRQQISVYRDRIISRRTARSWKDRRCHQVRSACCWLMTAPRSRACQAGLISREAPDDVVTVVANRWGFDESLERKWSP